MQSWGCVTSRVNEANPEGIGMFCATEVNEDNIATSVGFCEDYEGTWGSAQKPEGCGGAAAGGAAE